MKLTPCEYLSDPFLFQREKRWEVRVSDMHLVDHQHHPAPSPGCRIYHTHTCTWFVSGVGVLFALHAAFRAVLNAERGRE